MPQLVSAEEFLTRLGQCFSDPSSSSSVWLTHKRLTFSYHEDVEMKDNRAEGEEDGSDYEVLIRCTQGDRKFSVKVSASSLPSFHAAYGALIKQSMAPLMRKRDKKKEKARADELAKKRKELYVDIAIGDEGKRGKGRRQRQRKIAAQKKKEAERDRLETRQAEQKAAGEI